MPTAVNLVVAWPAETAGGGNGDTGTVELDTAPGVNWRSPSTVARSRVTPWARSSIAATNSGPTWPAGDGDSWRAADSTSSAPITTASSAWVNAGRPSPGI